MLIFSLASLTVGFLAGVTFSDRLVRPLSSTNITSSYSSIQILTNINKFWQILTNINKYHYIIFKYTLSKFVLPSFLDVTMFFSLVLTHHIYNPNLNCALFFLDMYIWNVIFVKDLIISILPYMQMHKKCMNRELDRKYFMSGTGGDDLNHTWYLSLFFTQAKFWRIKFTPKFTQKIANLHSKLPIYTVNCQFFALNL